MCGMQVCARELSTSWHSTLAPQEENMTRDAPVETEKKTKLSPVSGGGGVELMPWNDMSCLISPGWVKSYQWSVWSDVESMKALKG